MPQGTKLGPWLFLILINDLNLATPCSDHNAPRIWKYVDGTTASEVVIKGRESKAQQIADQVVHWSSENKMKFNSDKCKELRISFARNQTEFSPVIVNGKGLEVVQHAKLLGVTISSELSWNEDISNIVKKASKRLYFLVQLKRAKVTFKDLVLFYVACIRSILTYATPVFYCITYIFAAGVRARSKKSLLYYKLRLRLSRGFRGCRHSTDHGLYRRELQQSL